MFPNETSGGKVNVNLTQVNTSILCIGGDCKTYWDIYNSSYEYWTNETLWLTYNSSYHEAYGWGDHSLEGYQTGSELFNTTPEVRSAMNTTGYYLFTSNNTSNVHCSDIWGGSDGDYCTDATAAGSDGGNTSEEVQDASWDVLTGTQTRITVTYDDANNEVDFVVDDMTSTYNTTYHTKPDNTYNATYDAYTDTSYNSSYEYWNNETLTQTYNVTYDAYEDTANTSAEIIAAVNVSDSYLDIVSKSAATDDDDPESGDVFWSDLTDEADANLGVGNITEDVLTEAELDSISELNTQIADATLIQSGGTLTSSKWCVYDGTGIDCNVEPVSDTDTANTTTEIVTAINTTSYYQLTSKDLICSDCIGGTEIDESTLTGHSTQNDTYDAKIGSDGGNIDGTLNVTDTGKICFGETDVCIVNGTDQWIWLRDSAGTTNRNIRVYNLYATNVMELPANGKMIFGYTDVDKYILYNSTSGDFEFRTGGEDYHFHNADLYIENSADPKLIIKSGDQQAYIDFDVTGYDDFRIYDNWGKLTFRNTIDNRDDMVIEEDGDFIFGAGTSPVKDFDFVGYGNFTDGLCIGSTCHTTWYTYNATYDEYTTELNTSYLNITGCADNQIWKVQSDGSWACEADDTSAGGTDTNASTVCSGDTTYLSGEGNCNEISSLYINKTTSDSINGNFTIGDNYYLIFDDTFPTNIWNNGGTLTSDSYFLFRRPSDSSFVFGSQLTTSSNTEFKIIGDGNITWGSGDAATDTNLYRKQANELATDDNFYAGGNISSGENFKLGDNKKIIFGDDADWYMTFDGTSLIITNT